MSDLPDHVEATVELLERAIAKLRAGAVREDVGREITLIGRVLERKP